MRKSWDVSIDLAVTPDDAWALVGDPVGVTRWYELYTSCVVEGDIRTLSRADGVELVERLLERDDGRRYYAYQVVGGLPLASHRASFEVKGASGGSTFIWHTEAEHEDLEIDMEARLADRQLDAGGAGGAATGVGDGFRRERVVSSCPLPELPADQVGLLATQSLDGPVVVPVSALWREGDTRLLFALTSDRASASRLRADDRASMSLSGAGFSFCARGRALLLAERMPGAEHMSAFRFDITHGWDARGPATEIDDGIRWSWATPESAARHRAVLDALTRVSKG